MDDEELADRADENLWHTYAVLAQLLPTGAVHRDGTVLIASWGAAISYFNAVFVTSAVTDPYAVLDAARRFYGPLGLPYLIRVREHIAGRLPEVAIDSGLRNAGVSPGMAMYPLPEHMPSAPSGLELRAVEDAAGLADHCEVLAAGFGLPIGLVTQLFPSKLVGTSVTAFVGYVDGEPACCSALTVSGSTAGVYNVATPERFRKRGFGEAATWHAILEGRAVGCDHAILQASDMGRPIYERMGFRLVAPYLQFEGHPTG